MTQWLNDIFYGIDYAIFFRMHGLCTAVGDFFTPFMRFVSLFGDKGLFSIILIFVLLLFSKTRKTGFCVGISVVIATLIVNLIIKPTVARPRPYTEYPYSEWWQLVGGYTEKDFSFPSGHVNNITAVSIALFCRFKNKKIAWLILLCPIIMCFSRVYLMVHYPSDVLFALVFGSLSGIAGYLVGKIIYDKIAVSDGKFCKVLICLDLLNLFKKKNKK